MRDLLNFDPMMTSKKSFTVKSSLSRLKVSGIDFHLVALLDFTCWWNFEHQNQEQSFAQKPFKRTDRFVIGNIFYLFERSRQLNCFLLVLSNSRSFGNKVRM